MAKIRQMVSLELGDEEKLDACLPMPCEKPDFPYGTCFTLTDREFKKLGLDPAEAIEGGIFHGHFMSRIKSVTHTEHNGEKTCRVECQMEALSIESEDQENEEADQAEKPRRKSPLYAMADEEE